MRASLRKPELIGWILLGAAMTTCVALLVWLQRDLAFTDDSFNWLALSGLGSTRALIEPYGGHLIFVPLLLFKGVLEIAGDSYTAMGVVQLILLLALSLLLYIYGKRRIGALLALPAAIVVLFLGSSWDVMLQPMLGARFLTALVPGVAALLALERDDRRGDVAACVLLVLATWSFEMGLAFVAGAAVAIALRDDRWRRIWIVAVPIVVYGIWKIWAIKYGGSGLRLSNLIWVPAYAADSLAIVAVSLFGLYYWVGAGQLTALKLNGFNLNYLSEGVVILILAGIAIFLTVRRLRRQGPLPATFWVAVAVVVTLWVEQGLALSPDRAPGEIRYIFPGTIALLLFALEAARGVRTTRLSVLVAAALTVTAVAGNVPRFKEGRDILAEYSATANAAIAVMVLGGHSISPTFSPAADAPEAFPAERAPSLGAGTAQQLAARYGTPGITVGELLDQPEWVRRSADIVAAKALEVHTEAAGSSAASCRPTSSAGDTVTVPRGGAILVARRPSALFARRFAGQFVIEVGGVEPGQPMVLKIPGDSSSTPWHLQAHDSGGLTACPL